MIPLFKVLMTPKAIQNAGETLASGYIGQGPKVEQFESELASVLGAPILTMNSCTSAIDLALHLIGVGPGDTVISTPQTCTASNSPIVTRGATILWADVDPLTGLIDPESVARIVSRRTKAIIAVDWSGAACDYDRLKSFGIPVIEDAAHAFLATHKGKSIAQSGGHYVAWSFQAIKHLTTVDGGALRTPSNQFERARLLRWYGLDRRNGESFRCSQSISEVGYKFHMNDVAASIGLGNLSRAREAVEQCRSNAKFYNSSLSDLSRVTLPGYDSDACSHWLYTILVDDRDGFSRFMADRGVTVSPVHARNDKHDGFKNASYTCLPMTGLDHFSKHQVAIPVGWWLTNGDREHIADSVKAWTQS